MCRRPSPARREAGGTCRPSSGPDVRRAGAEEASSDPGRGRSRGRCTLRNGFARGNRVRSNQGGGGPGNGAFSERSCPARKWDGRTAADRCGRDTGVPRTRRSREERRASTPGRESVGVKGSRGRGRNGRGARRRRPRPPGAFRRAPRPPLRTRRARLPPAPLRGRPRDTRGTPGGGNRRTRSGRGGGRSSRSPPPSTRRCARGRSRRGSRPARAGLGPSSLSWWR